MCQHCLHSVAPDRVAAFACLLVLFVVLVELLTFGFVCWQGTTAHEGGVYLVNFKGCHVCKEFAVLKVHEKVVEEDDKEEKINFKRKVFLIIFGDFFLLILSLIQLFSISIS